MFLCFSHEVDRIAHSQNAVSHRLRAKGAEIFQFFSNTFKCKGLPCHFSNRDCSPSAGISIEHRQNGACNRYSLIKSASCIHSILTESRISDKKDLMWI